MKIIKYPFWCLWAIAACQSDTEQLREAEHRFLQIVSVPERLQVTAGGDTLFLPVLPALDAASTAKNNAVQLQQWMQKIDSATLEPSDRQRLSVLKKAVDDLVVNGVSIPADLVCTRIAEPFKQVLQYDNPELTQRFLEQLPVYFSEMEQRWQTPAAPKMPAVMQEATSAFDALQQLEQQSPANWKNKFTTARLALKDYIGLCQSCEL